MFGIPFEVRRCYMYNALSSFLLFCFRNRVIHSKLAENQLGGFLNKKPSSWFSASSELDASWVASGSAYIISSVILAILLLYIYSASMKSYQYRNFNISENIKYSSLATITFLFLVNGKLVWRDKKVARALELPV